VRAQIKVVLLVAVILIVTLSTVLWKTQGLLLEDKLNFVNDSAMKQVAPLKRLVSDRLETEKNDLVRFATSRESQGAGHATSFGVFDAVALVEPNASTGQWQPSWIEKGPGLRGEKWTEGYDLTLLKSLPYQKVKDGSALWIRLSDAQGAPLYAVLNSVEVQTPMTAPRPSASGALPESSSAAPVVTTPGSIRRAVIVGFASENPLTAVTEDYIGSSNSVYVVDDRGYVASHVKNAYLGNSFAEDKMTQEIIKTPKLTDTRETTDMDGQKVLGHFERVDHTNLAVVILTPVAAATGLEETFTHTVLYVGGGIGILALLLSYLVGGSLQSSPVYTAPRSPQAESYETPDSKTVQPPDARNLPQEISREELAAEPSFAQDDRLRLERRNAFEAFNAGLAARLREPLLAILGHARLAKSKSSDPDLIAHADSIEREARLAKDAIERFQIIEESSSLGPVTDKCDLEKVVLSALAERAIEIEGSGITLEQHVAHVPRVRGRSSDLESMIVHLLENSVEALRDRPMKKITVQLTWLNSRVRLLLSDSGIGMSRDVQERAFEPFFKAFEAPRHMGLGLAFVHTTIKRIGAALEVESSPGEGTVFTIEFPVDADAKKDYEASTQAPDLQQINASIDAFTLGGRRPLNGPIIAPTPPPLFSPNAHANEFTISSITNTGVSPASPDEPSDGFRVKIRRPKPRG
jgi:signal transduction histidine kinase